MISVPGATDDSGFPQPRGRGGKPADDPELDSDAYAQWATRNAYEVWSDLD